MDNIDLGDNDALNLALARDRLEFGLTDVATTFLPTADDSYDDQ